MKASKNALFRLTAIPGGRWFRIGWASLPTCLLIFSIEITHLDSSFFPIPFLLLLIAVGFAGYFAGQTVGAINGGLAAALVFHAHLEGFGPPNLTGPLPNTLVGMALFAGAGFLVGRLRDQSNVHLAALLEAQRREQEEPLLLASQLIKLGYYIWDTVKGEPIIVSDQHIRNYGTTRENFLSKVSDVGGDFLLVHPDDRQKVEAWCQQLKDGERVEMEYRIPTSAGTKWIRAIARPIRDDTGRIVKQICASMDITDQKAIETHLADVQKLESVGRLTAGIAHDFNNLLAVILGNLELLSEPAAEKHSTEFIDAAVRATLRGSDLTKKLLAFGRKTILNPEVVDANVIIRDMDEVFRRTLPATIEMQTALASDLWDVEVDRSLFENALLNLVINSRDAMPEGGMLTIESANVSVDEAYSDRLGTEIEPGRHVMIAVSDTGTGIRASELTRAFEPFFTTKEVGKGTGLGLSLVHGFVKQSGGSVQIYSEVGEGTTVKMYFPAREKPTQVSLSRTDEVQHEIPEGLCVLVVDDDPDVRQVVVRQMSTLGCRVFEAADGYSALEILRSESSIRLLLTDVVMPGEIQGANLADIASSEMPDLKVILMSGYAVSALENGKHKPNSYFKMMKPVQINELIRVVGRALNEG